jgi:hypothetical protein
MGIAGLETRAPQDAPQRMHTHAGDPSRVTIVPQSCETRAQAGGPRDGPRSNGRSDVGHRNALTFGRSDLLTFGR